MDEHCGNTQALNDYEFQQMLACKEHEADLAAQQFQGLDPVAAHITDMLECRDFYEHAGLALADNCVLADLLILLMRGEEQAGVNAVRSMIRALATLHAEAAVEEQDGLYLPRYTACDVNVYESLKDLQDYIEGLK